MQAATLLDRGDGVVMKAVAADIPHKSDHGLVRLRVAPEDAGAVFQELVAAAGTTLGDTGKSAESGGGVLVCEMRTGGVECVVGITSDALFGHVVMFGLGGTLLDVFDDVAFRVPPFDRSESLRMVAQTRVGEILAGHRGRPAADLDALVDVIMSLQRIALEHPDDLAEADINPLLVSESGATALDALVVGRERGGLG
jgi:succinyl-CoA synthetase beta subunit